MIENASQQVPASQQEVDQAVSVVLHNIVVDLELILAMLKGRNHD